MEIGDDGTFYDSVTVRQNLYGFLRSIYSRRELLGILISADLRSRYRRSLLGLLWTLINPIITSLVLWVVFVSIFKSRLINGTQFAPYLLAGVLTITFFNQGVLQGAESISNGTKLFLKIRVDPRFFCVSNVVANAANFFLGIIALFLVSWFTGASVSEKFPLVIFVGLSLILLSIGFGLILSILFIRYDDSKYITTILLQLLTYLTPVFYPKEMLGPRTNFLISLNPLSSYLDVFRNVFNETVIATKYDYYYMFSSSIIVFIVGSLIFKKYWTKTVVML